MTAEEPGRPGFSRIRTRRSACSAEIRSPARSKWALAESYRQRCGRTSERGVGVTSEYQVGHYYKRLLVLERAWGDLDFYLDRIARAYA